jgi:hypothetical protein
VTRDRSPVAASAPVKFWAPSPLLVSLPLQLLVALGCVALSVIGTPAVGKSAVPLLFGFAALCMAVPKQVHVSADGVRIGWVGPGRFVPYSTVKHACLDARGVVIALRSGRSVRVPFRPPFRKGEPLIRLFGSQRAIAECVEKGARAHRESLPRTETKSG